MKFTGTWKKHSDYIWLRTDNPNFGVKAPRELDAYKLQDLANQEVVSTSSLAQFVKHYKLVKREVVEFSKIEFKW